MPRRALLPGLRAHLLISSVLSPREAGVNVVTPDSTDAEPEGRQAQTDPASTRPAAGPGCHVGSGSWQLLPRSLPLSPAWKGSPPSPVRVLAELPLPHVVDRTETELVGARGDQALDRH